MCYYHPTGFRYAPSISYQYFIRPCRQAKFYATQLAYPVSSGASGSGPGSPGTVSMQSTQGILVRPCSSHYVADEVAGSEGDGDADVDICMDVPLDFDVDPDGYGDEDGEDDEEDEEEEDEEESEEEEEEEDNDEMEYTSTGLAISVPITSIQPGSGPSLKDVKPKPRSKRFKRDLISMPVQLLRWKWKRTMALRYVKKKAADTTAAAVSSSSSPSSAAGSQRPQMFNNNGFWSWHGPLPVQMQRHGQGWVQSPNGSFTYNSWEGRGLERIRAAGGFC